MRARDTDSIGLYTSLYIYIKRRLAVRGVEHDFKHDFRIFCWFLFAYFSLNINNIAILWMRDEFSCLISLIDVFVMIGMHLQLSAAEFVVFIHAFCVSARYVGWDSEYSVLDLGNWWLYLMWIAAGCFCGLNNQFVEVCEYFMAVFYSSYMTLVLNDCIWFLLLVDNGRSYLLIAFVFVANVVSFSLIII